MALAPATVGVKRNAELGTTRTFSRWVAVMVAVHAMTAGTDSTNPAFRVVTFTLVTLLTALTAFRFFKVRRKGAPSRVPASVGTQQRHPAMSSGSANRPLATMVPGPASDPRTEVR